MKTITFYSYKGGVGRTLALSNIAKRLSEFGKKVCLIDFDLEAPGLHHKFSYNLRKKDIKTGIVDYIYQFSVKKILPKTIKKFSTKIDFNSEHICNIDLIAAGNIYSKDYWKNLSLINWSGMFYEENSQGIAFFIDLKEKIRKELKPDFLLIDSRTGITDISGITMSVLADEIVLFVANNEENIEGIKQVIETLSIPENTFTEGIPKITLVLSRIPYFSKPNEKYKELIAKDSVLNTINEHLEKNNNPNKIQKILVIHSDRDLEFQEKFKIGYEHEKTNSPIAFDYLKLFEELTNDILSEKEKKKFNNHRKSQQLIEQANIATDNILKIKLLKQAIELNSNADEAYYQLANIYYEIKEYNKSLKFIDLALINNSNNLEYLILKGFVHYHLLEYEEASEIGNFIIKIDKTHFNAIRLMGLICSKQGNNQDALNYHQKTIKYYQHSSLVFISIGNIYRRLKDYEKAFEFIYKALEIEPQNYFATGTLAEIYAQLGNKREFYKNLTLAFSFGLPQDEFERVVKEEEVYKSFLKDENFLAILDKYNINIDFLETKK